MSHVEIIGAVLMACVFSCLGVIGYVIKRRPKTPKHS